MPTNKIVLYYIEKITLEDARIICIKNNWDFSDNEIIFILNFARQYKEYLNKESKDFLLYRFKQVTNENTYNKVLSIVKQFI